MRFFICLHCLVTQFRTSNYKIWHIRIFINKTLIFINVCLHQIEKTHKWARVSVASSDEESRLRMRWNLYGFMTLDYEDIPLHASWRSSNLWHIEVSRVSQNLKVALMSDEGDQWNTNDLQTFKFNLESIILYFMGIYVKKMSSIFSGKTLTSQQWREKSNENERMR